MTQMQLEFTDQQKEAVKTQADKLLELLRRGPATRSLLIENISHRFSSSVNVLRNRGHEIHVTHGQFEDVYHLGKQTPRVEVAADMQDAYYQTDHWRCMRAERKEHDGYRCCHCKSTAELHVHHWHYELFNECLSDLATLCEPCHTRIHENKNISIHFPRFVSPEIAERLKQTE